MVRPGFLPARLFAGLPDGVDRALPAVRRVRRAELRTVGRQLRLGRFPRALDCDPKVARWAGGLSFPLGSDLDGAAARAYGVFQAQDRLAVRGLFIVDPEGLVQYQVVHSLSVGRRSQEVLRVLAALQSGGLCREDWMADGQTIDPFQVIRPGSYFSHYQIEAEAGAGTFAKVFRAHDLQLDRSVALKVFKPDCPVTPSAALAEARVAAALNHPNLCTIYAVDDSAGVPIISMEYIAGEPLSKAIKPGQLPTGSLLVDHPPDRLGNGGGAMPRGSCTAT